MKVLATLPLDLPVRRVAGLRPCVARPGAFFEIRGQALHPLPLPHDDCLALAVDGTGRLIASRESGDRYVRRYRDGRLDATYPFAIDQIVSLAVDEDRVTVVKRDGTALGFDSRTVPKVDYSFRLGGRFRFCDALGGRIALTGADTVICDAESGVIDRLPAASRVRLRPDGVWRIDDGLWLGTHRFEPGALGLHRIEDVIAGAEEWAIGDALVRFEISSREAGEEA